MLSSAVVPLLSSIVGGVLVLAGQALARRYEDRRAWLTRFYEASGDLATSYLQEAALVNDSRRSQERKADVATTTYVADRQKALGRFRTLPWAPHVEAERQAMGRAIQAVWRAWDRPDEEFQRAYDESRDAVAAFAAAVGAVLVDPPRTRRGWRPRRG